MIDKKNAIQGLLGEVTLSSGRPLADGTKRFVMRDTETGAVVGELTEEFVTCSRLSPGSLIELWEWEEVTIELPREFSLTSPSD